MAAGTEIVQPVSALDGAYKPLPLDPLTDCSLKEKGGVVDNNKHDGSALGMDRIDRDNTGRPPRPLTVEACASPAATVKRCASLALISSASPSDSVSLEAKDDVIEMEETVKLEFVPIYRSGGWADIGSRRSMEDAHVCIDDLEEHLGSVIVSGSPGAFYGVFDGHGGKDAAYYVREHLLHFILEDVSYPTAVEDAMRNAFLRLDHAFAQMCLRDSDLSSGTTALSALICGRNLLVANAGDCRAVLCRKGKAVEMSRDHKPGCSSEKIRIEAVGGYVDDGYLNGQLAVARAIGDWHMDGLKEEGVEGPLSAEPEMQQAVLSDEDEFLIIGCDGLWDVFTSQNAVDFARKKLQQHNDPERCSKELVTEALRRESCDNLTVVTVCFTVNPPPSLGVWKPRARRSFSAEGISQLQGFLDGCL